LEVTKSNNHPVEEEKKQVYVKKAPESEKKGED
jgi:hypothetical protein